MKRSKRWLTDDPMRIIMVATALSVLIVAVGFTAAAHWDAKREFAFKEWDGSLVARWNDGHYFSYVVYFRSKDGDQEEVGLISGIPMGTTLAIVKISPTWWRLYYSSFFPYESTTPHQSSFFPYTPYLEEEGTLIRLLSEGRRRTGQIT